MIAARILERRMPIYRRTYSPGELQFITTSTYRRAPVFFSPRFCHYFVQGLWNRRFHPFSGGELRYNEG
jgi:hypothetical protein